jgi:hypothetical protein
MECTRTARFGDYRFKRGARSGGVLMARVPAESSADRGNALPH